MVYFPAAAGRRYRHPAPGGPRCNCRAGLWLAGFGFEAVADAQLAAFRARPQNRGRVMDSGLWRHSRHPNYFGECGLVGILPGGRRRRQLVDFSPPLLMTFLLLRVSGVTLLERTSVNAVPPTATMCSTPTPSFPRPPRTSARGTEEAA